jgi:predicted ATPase
MAMKRIVLTGGPGAGKTVVSAHISRAHPDRYVLVPEAATQVYGRLNTRWSQLDTEGRRDLQRRIYRLQLEQEERIAQEYPDRILLLDRGTIDGAAYWPDGPEAYWSDLGTTLEAELDRYDLVIWMETSAALGVYDGQGSNPCRSEDAVEAVESGKRLLELWKNHPNLKHVGVFSSIEEKIRAVGELLNIGN